MVGVFGPVGGVLIQIYLILRINGYIPRIGLRLIQQLHVLSRIGDQLWQPWLALQTQIL